MRRKIKLVTILIFAVFLLMPLGRVLALAAPAGIYSTGSLVNDGGTIYFISGSYAIPFSNYQAFTGLGYSLSQVVNGSTLGYLDEPGGYILSSKNQDHPWGSWLLYNGTVYYYNQDGIIPVPSPEVFSNNDGSWNQVLPANQYDLIVLNRNPNLAPLADNDPRMTDGLGNVIDACAPTTCSPSASPVILNSTLPQIDSAGQPFGFLDDLATTTIPTVATATPPIASSTIPAAPSSVTTSNPSIPSEPSITLPPTAAAGLPVTVTASATDSSGSPLSYVFNWGDGSAPVTSSSSTATHTYATAGNYTVLVTVVNSAGMINSQSINISVGQKQ